MPLPPRRPRTTLFALLALWAVFYASFTLLTPPLLDDADSVHAEVAREMLLRHDYVTLYANGIRYLEKAPLLYWSMAACMRLAQALGATSPRALAIAARVPMALTVLALALLVEAFTRRGFADARAGLYAGLILLSSPGVFLFTRLLLPDALVCLWLTLALYTFWRSEEEVMPRYRWCGLFAVACALNVLSKGLIGVVFPLAIAAIYLLLARGALGTLRRAQTMHIASSLAVFLLIAAPWHVLIALANPAQGHPDALSFTLHPAAGAPHWTVPLPRDGNVHGWLWFYFINEQVLRYLNLRVPRDYDTVPLWLFLGLCLVWLMPWSAYLFQSLRRFVPAHSAKWRRELMGRRMDGRMRFWLLLAIWAALVPLFFVFSTRQEYYVLPAFPAFAILIGGWLGLDSRVSRQSITHEARGIRRAALRATLALVVLGAVFAAAAGVVLLRSQGATRDVDLAAMLQQNPGDYAMSMGHFLDLNARALGLFRVPLAIAAGSLLLGPLVSYMLRQKGKPDAATLALAGGAFGFLLAVHLGLQMFAPVLSSAELAAAIAPLMKAAPGELEPLVVIHQEYEFGSTLGFYLQRPSYRLERGRPVALDPIHILTEPEYRGTLEYGRSSNLWYGSYFADAPRIFDTQGTLAAAWASGRRVLLWQDLDGQPSGPPALPGTMYVIARSGGKEILSNQPNR